MLIVFLTVILTVIIMYLLEIKDKVKKSGF